MSEDAVIVFKASMPPIGTALRISGDGNGARLLLDIPEIEMEAVAALLAMRREALIVTVQRAARENLTELDYATTEEPKRKVARVDLRRTAKRRD